MSVALHHGDCRDVLATLPAESVQCCVTSPPYMGLRDYQTGAWEGGDPACNHQKVRDRVAAVATSTLGGGKKTTGHIQEGYRGVCARCGAVRVDRQIGMEPSPAEYVAALVDVFRGVRRVLRPDGTAWLNLGSSYASRDTRPSQSRPPQHAPACDTRGKAREGSPDLGSACSDLRGEPLDGLCSHHGRTVGNAQSADAGVEPLCTTGHGSGHQDCAAASPAVLPLDAQASNIPSLPRNAQADGDREDMASAYQPLQRTSSPASPASDHMSACTCGTATNAGSSSHRTSGTVSSSAACGDPKCDGSCGKCWAYLAIPLLKIKQKDLIDIPTLVALALQADGWFIRSEIIWSKAAPMPESVRDRPTCAHEKVWLLTKAASYFYDADAVAEPATFAGKTITLGEKSFSKGQANGANVAKSGNALADEYTVGTTRNLRNVWHLNPEPFSGWVETVRRVRVASDAPADGKKRITSPGCPLHGDRPARAPKASYGGRGADASTRTACSDARLVPEPAASPAPIGQHHGAAIVGENSGWLLPECSPSATVHSSGTSRTDLAPATTPACTPSAETDSRTHGTSVELELSAHRDCMPESNTGSDGSACSASPQMQSRTARKSGGRGISSASGLHLCTCEYYVEIAEKTSHFATMPPTLAERCIKAGTSEKGQCPHCGAPWGRVTAEPVVAGRRDPGGVVGGADAGMYAGRAGSSSRDTIGWRPSCSCPAHEPVPQTILDCFAGAGTTLLVADRLQRNGIGIELNAQYIAIAQDRLRGDAPLFAEVA